MLREAGVKVKRRNWTDNDDFQEWIDIKLKNKDGSKKYTVHFHFIKNATQLVEVNMYRQKRKTGYDQQKLIAMHKEFPIMPPPQEQKPPIPSRATSGTVTITVPNP